MKNLYHYTLAMLYLKVARFYADDDRWFVWMKRSVEQIGKVKP